ncbi:MAG TPA: aspartate aminotransferase family protein, partial [Dermatophilaceae bacterium]|nr:aspartate aminotransferase family protein [Dermatophilaceae bacterium]
MHRFDEQMGREAVDAVLSYAARRLRLDPAPLDGPLTPGEIADAAGPTITPGGLGLTAALEVYGDVLAPA